MMIYRLVLHPAGQHTCDVTCMLILIVLSNQLLMQLSSNPLFKGMSKFFSFPITIKKRVTMLSQVTFFTLTLGFEAEHDTAMCVCPYLNWSSFKSGFWAFRYLVIVSSSLGTGSLKEVEHRDVHLMSKGKNEALHSHLFVSFLPYPSLNYYIYYTYRYIHTHYTVYTITLFINLGNTYAHYPNAP